MYISNITVYSQILFRTLTVVKEIILTVDTIKITLSINIKTTE